VFPASWKRTRLILLYKKGDGSDLANWRRLSLTNSDAKLFTKILTHRMLVSLKRIINPYQTGFMPNRSIADNGWALQALMAHARHTAPSSSAVGVLLDQEKAYDRIHPEYLSHVMLAFGYPFILMNSIVNLFFSTEVHVSINGFLAGPFTQARGLRQGDPLSPLLFNIAFEPLLRKILADPKIPGFRIHSIVRKPSRYNGPGAIFPDALPIKFMAYADDLLVLLSKPAEWAPLLENLHTYRKSSNAKVNAKDRSFSTGWQSPRRRACVNKGSEPQ
jgi:hypothetical protein